MQVLIELLFHALDHTITVDQIFKHFMDVASIKHYWSLLSLGHDHAPEFVHSGKCLEDFRQLSLDVGGAEDRPQVAPASLHPAPFFQDVLNFNETRLPEESLIKEVLSVGRTWNDHRLLDVFVKKVPDALQSF